MDCGIIQSDYGICVLTKARRTSIPFVPSIMEIEYPDHLCKESTRPRDIASPTQDSQV